MVSGGGDKTAKFWQFQLIEDPEMKCKVLSLAHTRTLKVNEGVLCVRISPNNRFIAVSLLDSTVKIFFLDSFKVFAINYQIIFISFSFLQHFLNFLSCDF